jgi:hypothetical protein
LPISLALFDKTAYGELLAATLPGVIRTDRENERLIAEMERVDSLPLVEDAPSAPPQRFSVSALIPQPQPVTLTPFLGEQKANSA